MTINIVNYDCYQFFQVAEIGISASMGIKARGKVEDGETLVFYLAE
jgi:hypothetical protein